MQAGTLRALEFDRVVEAVRGFALTPMGEDRLTLLAPSTDPDTVTGLLGATTEATRYLAKNPLFPLRASSEMPAILQALSIEGRALETHRLLALATFLDSVDETRTNIRRSPVSFPLLEGASAGAASFRVETGRVRDTIDPSGDVVDHASPELKLIRDRLRRQRARLRGTLESYLRGKETAKYLQDQVVTERNGRYVLVIKAEHRTAIPGIVHGSSTSGASLYLEPLSTVETNNDIVALEEQEAEEVRRILLALADAFRTRAADLQRTVQAAADLDVIQARARFSESIGGVEPALSNGPFELLAARHPLLIRAARQSSRESGIPAREPVPVTIRIVPPATALLITGPNTGGKTVALKTAGLLALMAQAGLHIPAATGSRLPVFRSLFADIGDDQSIEASLSTFSAHVAHIAAMDQHFLSPGLVLLDEVGSGTDPIEGGALGVAVVDHFRRRGATLVATSHYDALKTYASTTGGVTSAAFGFDPETFAPTYQLVYGSPGRSLALEIAARLGLSSSIVAAARGNLTAREAQLAEHLAKVDQEMRALEHQQRLVLRERQMVEADEARMREREGALHHREETFRRRLTEELDAQARRARREIDDVIAALRVKADALANDALRQRVSTGDTGVARNEARAAVDAVVKRMTEPATDDPDQPGPGRAPEVGDRVLIGNLRLEGTVLAVHEDTAEVDVRGKRLRSSVRDLRVIDGTTLRPVNNIQVRIQLQPRDATQSSDLNIIGCTVDEAIARAERFLDESLLTDQRVLRVIHGHGTGQLRRAIAGFLQRHPLVARFETATPERGGGGVTIVELKD